MRVVSTGRPDDTSNAISARELFESLTHRQQVMLLEAIGTIPRDLPHWVHIDWEATAREVKVDYSEVSIDGVTYFYR